MGCCAAMASKHWTIDDIESEVNAMRVLIQARPGKKDLATQLLGQLKHKLENMPALSANQVVALYDLVKKCGLPDSMKEELNALVDEKATSDSSTTKPASQTDCFNLIDFFTTSELNQLETCSMWQGASIVASRLKMLGFRAMKESTKKSATAVLVWFETKRAKDMVPPDGDTVYSLSQHGHHSFVTCTTPVPAGVPSLPNSLPGRGTCHRQVLPRSGRDEEASCLGSQLQQLGEPPRQEEGYSAQSFEKIMLAPAKLPFVCKAKIMRLSTAFCCYSTICQDFK